MRKLKLQELNRLSAEEYVSLEKLDVTVVLDNIRSAHNVGSIFRTMDGFAFEKLYLCGITAKPPHKELHKTAIGSTQTVSWEYNENIVDTLNHLKSEGYKLVGVEQIDQSESLQTIDFNFKQPYAIIFGNEVNGLSDSILALLDMAVEIPQYGTKHSFNISVCAGMVMWEISKQLRG